MGKEQDLLDAARTGNIAVIEKILNIRSKKSGPLGLKQLQGAFDSLRRPTNLNCQDVNGYTPLHLASLNGHQQIVRLLLQHEASANIIDNTGCQPLYWAAWNGHADICQDLLSQGQSFATVNEQNHDGETALLCGSQYGHTDVIDILLEHNSDCSLRNHKGESSLDLACQYGRVDTVRLLLDRKPQLVSEIQENISALHLASRNGHKSVVQLLIERGFDINTKTETGSALHEAALCGKEDVVLFLLDQGIDVYLKDSNDRSAVEVLSDHKSQKSLDIGSTILEHLERLGLSPTKPRPASSLTYQYEERNRPVSELYSTPVKVQKAREASRERVESESSTTSSQLELPASRSSRAERPCSDPIYDIPQPHPTVLPKGKSPSFSEGSFHSPHGSTSSLGSSPGRSPKSRHEVPKKPPRKKKPTGSHETSLNSLVDGSMGGMSPRDFPHDPSSPKVIHIDVPPKVSDEYSTVGEFSQNNQPPTSVPYYTQDSGDYVSLANVTAEARMLATTLQQQGQVNSITNTITATQSSALTTLTSSVRENSEDIDKKHPVFDGMDGGSRDVEDKTCQFSITEDDGGRRSEEGKEVVLKETSVRGSETARCDSGHCDDKQEPENQRDGGDTVITRLSAKEKDDGDKRASLTSSTPSSRPVSLEISTASSKRSSVEVGPLSPSGYQQPPTPDFPPPSPMTALMGIHNQIQPNKDRRLSRDMETITEQEYLHEDGKLLAKTMDCQTETDHLPDTEDSVKKVSECQGRTTGSGEVVMRKKSDSSNGSSIEEILSNGENPFFGLSKGSIPAGQRRVKSQIYDNVIVHPIAKLKKRLSTPGISSFDPRTFEPVPERDELLQRSSEGSETDTTTLLNKPSSGGDAAAMTCEVVDPCDTNTTPTVNDVNRDLSGRGEDINTDKTVDIKSTEKQLVEKPSDSSSIAQSSSSLRSSSTSTATTTRGETLEQGDQRLEQQQGIKDSDDNSDMALAGEIRTQRRESFKSQGGGDRLEDVMSASMDESEEWAQISDLIKSAGGRMSTAAWQDYDFYEKQLQHLFAKEKGNTTTMQSVGDWLESIGLPQYENTFIANGYDDMEFMGSNVLEYTDLVELGITEEDHTMRILEAAKCIPPVRHIGSGPGSQTVDDWLDTLQLPEYLQTFRMNGFHTVDRVQNVWELELNSVLDTAAYGHKRRILASLRSPDSPRTSGLNQDADDDRLDKMNYSNLPHTGVEAKEENLFKDYTKPLRSSNTLPSNRTRSQPPPLPVQRSRSANDTVLDLQAAIDIRPPNTSHVRQWRHRPEVLIKGCCNYNAQYLGSTLVKNLVGLESTKESIARMKKSTAGIGKIPIILLSISYKGVKFIDAKSKKVICEHEISNIFCACQDGDNLNYFAYITKDLATNMLYCHVFCVKNTDLATEIILTLGEAFEVAYQMALREEKLQAQNSTLGGELSQTGSATNGESKRSLSAETDV